MNFTTVSYDQVPFIAEKDLAYINQIPALKNFYKHEVNIHSFEQIIQSKSDQPVDRTLLVEVISDQYKSIETSEAVKENIKSLSSPKTFTIITAHQPCLFTGPLYFIYKICSALHLTRLLKSHYPNYHFVPVFIMGGEDHDFEEINHLSVYGKEVTWHHPDPKGPVGRMNVEGIAETIDQLESILGSSTQAVSTVSLLRKFFNGSESYGKSMIRLVNHLFSQYGLVTVSMDNARLKSAFSSIIKDDLINQTSHKIVKATQKDFDQVGFSDQAYVRKINSFFIKGQDRERIIKTETGYQIGAMTYDQETILEMLESSPEDFSPNVVLRPIYQEMIFPNLAYIGGGGEIAYWLERKQQFEHYGILFPMLIRRNSVLFLNKGLQKNLAKTDLPIQDLFTRDLNHFLTQWVADKESVSIEEERNAIHTILEKLEVEAAKIEPTLKQYVGAEGSKMMKFLDHIEKRMLKAAKSNQDVSINRISTIYEKLFPAGSLQERKDNFLSIYLIHGDQFFDYLVEILNPLLGEFIIIEE